jgi:nitrilase
MIKGVKLTLAAAICWENYMPLLRQSLYSQNVNLYLAPTADGRDTWLPLLRTIACEGRCAVLSANQCIKESNLPGWITRNKSEGVNGNAYTSGTPMSPRLRRKSTITNDGHEIALPEAKGPVTPIEEGNEGWNGKSGTNGIPRPPRLRRKSTVTAEGHEIALPETKSSMSGIEEDQVQTKSRSEQFISRGGSCIVSPMGEVLAGPLWDDDNGLITYDVDFDDCVRGRLDLDVGGSYSRYCCSLLNPNFMG